MLYHPRPRAFALLQTIELSNVTLEPLGLVLLGGIGLATRRPYSNMCYSVGCRRQGRKAIDRILTGVSAPVDVLDHVARRAVDAASVAMHRVDYMLLDRHFGTVNDDMVQWLGHTVQDDPATTTRLRPDDFAL